MFANPNAWCPTTTRGLAVEPAFNLQWAWSSGTVAVRSAGHIVSYVIFILRPCRKEIAAFPEEIRGDLADALARLDAGLMLSLPLSRPMPAIGWCTPWALAARYTCSLL